MKRHSELLLSIYQVGYHFVEMAPILELRRLVKDYPAHRAVDQISLSVPRGGFYSLLGPSGCGKTTTLRLIAGFEEPTSGDVLLDGVVVTTRKPYQRNVSTVFQNYALFPHMTVKGNVEFGLKRKNAKNIAVQVGEALEMVQLDGKADRYPAQLSGGERQRVALARSLVLRPDVLLLDEPLAALDPKLRRQMRLELKHLQRRVGITFLLVTHDQEEALSMSDSIAVMESGRIQQVGTPEDVYLRPQTRFVAGFLGAVNWIDGIGLRPEVIRIVRTPETNGMCSRPAIVTGSVFLGDCMQVITRLATGGEAVAKIPRGPEQFQTGESVHLCWQATDELTFP
jgi:ABC-type Fe3+/spermidine/putrescine transport system ATPase subunit